METLVSDRKVSTGKTQVTDKQNVRVAVVEDDAMYRQAIEVYLKKIPGIEIHSFESGEQCFRDYGNIKPDVLVLDYRLSDGSQSGMDGLDVMRKAKSIRPDTKIVFLAGQGSMDVAVAAIKGGAVDYITKDKNGLTRLVELIQRLALGIQIRRQESNTTRWIIIGVAAIALIVLGTIFADTEGMQGAWNWLWFVLIVGAIVVLIRSWVKHSRTETKKIQSLDSRKVRKWID